ncbi:hypothetical protein BDY19DRAFT_995100 [Irpex rosettiformis]|uniref:Uncharacterized protein n=1 Tax=Irpex rosettiformis TaxID=378272 RepID=A0ACB8U011_9APHY|nr:hypothetical protein BDY19DRAFT_995100 [Irpex rosettiformis]
MAQPSMPYSHCDYNSRTYSAPTYSHSTHIDDPPKDVGLYDQRFEDPVMKELASQVLLPRKLMSDKKSYPHRLIPYGSRSSYHLLNASLLVVWVALIAVEIVLMERSVSLAPMTTSLLWYYSITGLPSVLNTAFAQGHGIITVMHLSRLFVSALDIRHGRPRTWLEMFWIANQNWFGPVTMLTTGLTMLKMRVRVSGLFTLFSLISIVALVTPIALDRAYPIKTLDVPVSIPFMPSVLSPSRLLGIDAYAQLAAGRGSWTTNRNTVDMFNSTT